MAQEKRSFFVVVEGLDGTGKSSITRRLAALLNEPDCLPESVKLTFEPHDPSACGLYLRQVLMHRLKAPVRTLALAFAVNRADHGDRDIRPFLAQANGRSRVVICDRYYMSSMVYQSDDTFPMARVIELNSAALTPDLTLFLNARDRTCYARMRKREQNKELFETNLRATRQKYMEAIALLRERGEKIVEVPAEGSMSQVLNRVLDALTNHAPRWLSSRIHPRLITEEQPTGGETGDISVHGLASALLNDLCPKTLIDGNSLRDFFLELRKSMRNLVGRMSHNTLRTLFLDMLRSDGYTLGDGFPWTDLHAVELSYTMPHSMVQRGAAVFLADTQRYDKILQGLLGDESVRSLRRMSDFMFILDANPSLLHSRHYERDHVQYVEDSDTSPAIVIIGREDLEGRIASTVLDLFHDEFFLTIQSCPGLSALFMQVRNEFGWETLPRRPA